MMIQPHELSLDLPMAVGHGAVSTTRHVWDILFASYHGNLEKVKELAESQSELLYAQYNYTPPIHFAVREGHVELVKYLLKHGAYDPSYKTYPFLDNLPTVANDRGHLEIARLLETYASDPTQQKYKGDTGQIYYNRTEEQLEFERAIDEHDVSTVEKILLKHPEFAIDKTFFWGEGILMMPAKENQLGLIDLLMNYGANVPDILKWAQYYYFEHPEVASYMMAKGMNPNTKSWHHVTILHDMAQKGHIEKAELLLNYGADMNAIEEEYQSTPLGLASRWGQLEMVRYLLDQGADPKKAGATWATPVAWAKRKEHSEIEKVLSA